MADEKEKETSEVTEEAVREGLRTVMDPELQLDVVTLGLIQEIDLESSPAQIKMLLTTPFCPYAPWLLQQVKEAAETTVGGEVKVEMLAKQWSPEMMEDPSLLGFF